MTDAEMIRHRSNDPLSLRERVELAMWLVESVDQCDDTERALDFISDQIRGKHEAAP